jgi:hypothetical protein
MKIKGIIRKVFDTQHLDEITTRREFILDSGSYGCFNLFLYQQKCSLIDQYSIGQAIEVDITVKTVHSIKLITPNQ